MWTKKQIFKTALSTLAGMSMGLISLQFGEIGFIVLVTFLGAFVGFALSLPGVSATRVARGVVGAIIAHNAPAPMRRGIMETFTGSSEDSQSADPLQTEESEGKSLQSDSRG